MPNAREEQHLDRSRHTARRRVSKDTSSDASAFMRLQRLAGNSGVAQLLSDDTERSQVTDVVGSGGGQPLDPQTKEFMESRLGYDFGDVRIHTGSEAAESARSVEAQAYTVGTDIVFNTDKYSPKSPEGARMLAHELTHVIQQKSGPVDGTPGPGGIKLSDPGDRFERAAEATADRVVRGGPVPNASAPASAGVQRESEDEPLQRQADELEEPPEEEEEDEIEE